MILNLGTTYALLFLGFFFWLIQTFISKGGLFKELQSTFLAPRQFYHPWATILYIYHCNDLIHPYPQIVLKLSTLFIHSKWVYYSSTHPRQLTNTLAQ